MRTKLKNLEGCRERFKGRFERTGSKNQYLGPPKQAVLIQDIVRLSNQTEVTDHLWFNMTQRIKELNLERGDMIAFDARVKKYEKGYQGRREGVLRSQETDYKLNYPTKIEKI